MTDSLEHSAQYWDQHARRDPLWAVLSDPVKKDGQWDVGRFFETGLAEISAIFYELDSRRIAIGRRAALDFGCGVGRLTQALATRFDRVIGVDVSPAMLDVAARLNRFPDRLSFLVNQSPDLSVFPDHEFDLIVSSLALQHVPPDLALRYLREFFRVLAPAGVAVVQLPSHRRGPDDRPPAAVATAMPDEAYRASLAVSGVPGAALRPSSEVTLEVEITNRGGLAWREDAFGAIRVGNHWLDGDGARMLRRDDGRTSLPATLGAGETCRVPLMITAPSDEGEYQCEIDLAHEGVLWFHDKGSPVARFAARVSQTAETRPGPALEPPSAPVRGAGTMMAAPDAPSIPRLTARGGTVDADGLDAFPMYGVLSATVHELIASQDATLIVADPDRSCGDEWVSYRYFARKGAGDR